MNPILDEVPIFLANMYDNGLRGHLFVFSKSELCKNGGNYEVGVMVCDLSLQSFLAH